MTLDTVYATLAGMTHTELDEGDSLHATDWASLTKREGKIFKEDPETGESDQLTMDDLIQFWKTFHERALGGCQLNGESAVDQAESLLEEFI